MKTCLGKKRPWISSGRVFALAWFAFLTNSANAELLLFDNFEYVVNRDNSSLPGERDNAFVTQGPWTYAKAVNLTGSDTGRLYTTDAVPGYDGPMPGTEPSGRVLKMESINTQGGSDFYLAYQGSSTEAVPGSVWFQWWMYINHYPTGPYGPELSGLENRHKFIYPTADTFPSNSNKWLISLSSNPYSSINVASPFGSPTATGEAFVIMRDASVGQVSYTPGGDNASKLGPNRSSLSDSYIVPNRWHLIKIHLDTTDSNSGKFEVWMQPLGGEWRKISEWIGGVTPNFTWTGFPAGGHRGFRMPTTLGWTNTSGGAYYYVDDFAMASTEDSLPVYGPQLRPGPPRGVTVE